ncbi:uncharacterized protein MEPE_00092 [Melanopsichium pennsylvanicum]|uniref:HECT-type E3 ubiquitin transferase n=2 Tax=Melanopsichium pennsylvanicum TaxID=63383 RepID=A0AAJ4XFY7_9BASI|nr:uncharacterized protein MEPE_00092 [Melanopsichium pennsylvanicum]
MWGANKSWAPAGAGAASGFNSSSSMASSSRTQPQSHSDSAFPALSSPQVRRPSSRPHSNWSSSSSSLISTTSFNPYPTRRQELAQRAAINSTRERSHITRSDPSTSSNIHSLFDYEGFDDAQMSDLNPSDDGDDEGLVSSRGATMSSIVFRDLSSSASTSRSASPWQQGGLSPGLAIFASTTFGGEPLRVLSNVDDELGAAHMGPRIYKRHNQKHVRNRVRERSNAAYNTVAPSIPIRDTKQPVPDRATSDQRSEVLTAEDKERLREVDLQKVVDECRRYLSVVAIQNRLNSNQVAVVDGGSAPTTTLLAAIQARVADPPTWTTSTSPVISNDILPIGLQAPPVDFSSLPQPLLVQVRQSVLQGLTQLVSSIINATHTELVITLSQLLNLRPLRPTSTQHPNLKPSLSVLFLDLLSILNGLTNPTSTLSAVINYSVQTSSALLVELVSELVGLCGQQMSSNPTVLTETQDRTLVTAATFLSHLFALNATRPTALRLPANAFYCTVLDLAPFLEHFVYHAASYARTSGSTLGAGMAQFNIAQYPFLLSLGAKIRILQFENELRISRVPPRDTSTAQRLTMPGSDAELVVLPSGLNLKINRENAWEESRGLFLALLEAGDPVRGLRVEFAGEQAADGGGPAREWFATLASTWHDHRQVFGFHGWFIPCTGEARDQVETASLLGLLLALAAFHTNKVALPLRLPDVAFKIAASPSLDEVALTPVDLEFFDSALAKSLQSVLDWTPPNSAGAQEVDKLFDSTFSLTWSTIVRTAEGEVSTIDLVPGGRHRSVKEGERAHFVSKLVWQLLIGRVRKQVGAFREAWQSVMPSGWLHTSDARKGAESATEILSRGGLAMSLLSAEEISQAILSIPSHASSSSSLPLDVADIKGATDIIYPTATTRYNNAVVQWFWDLWAIMSPLHQRRLLAFITGAEDLPAMGARGIGLRIHLVPTDVVDARSWPLPWSSTCTCTLFLPTYPSQELLADKVGIAIEHYQGFGLR